MATCENCVHYELCQYNTYQEAHYFGKDKEIYITIKNNSACKFFKPTADVVEVVRCKDCQHCEIIIDQFDNDWYFCKKTNDNAEVKSDDFCSYGERKEK